jgi:hypothetical protein
MSDVAQQIDWTASAASGSGIDMPSATGVLAVPSEAKSTQTVEVDIPPSTPEGEYAVTFALQSSTGTVLPDLVAEVDVS